MLEFESGNFMRYNLVGRCGLKTDKDVLLIILKNLAKKRKPHRTEYKDFAMRFSLFQGI